MSKYRIVKIESDYRSSNSYYVVQVKRTFLFWSFWNHETSLKTLEGAKSWISASSETFTNKVIETI